MQKKIRHYFVRSKTLETALLKNYFTFPRVHSGDSERIFAHLQKLTQSWTCYPEVCPCLRLNFMFVT